MLYACRAWRLPDAAGSRRDRSRHSEGDRPRRARHHHSDGRDGGESTGVGAMDALSASRAAKRGTESGWCVVAKRQPPRDLQRQRAGREHDRDARRWAIADKIAAGSRRRRGVRRHARPRNFSGYAEGEPHYERWSLVSTTRRLRRRRNLAVRRAGTSARATRSSRPSAKAFTSTRRRRRIYRKCRERG